MSSLFLGEKPRLPSPGQLGRSQGIPGPQKIYNLWVFFQNDVPATSQDGSPGGFLLKDQTTLVDSFQCGGEAALLQAIHDVAPPSIREAEPSYAEGSFHLFGSRIIDSMICLDHK